MRWKEQLIKQRAHIVEAEPADVYSKEELSDYDKVKTSGVFMDEHSLFVGPRPRSIPGFGILGGYLLVTPLYDPSRKGVVLVNRGWVPASWKDDAAKAQQQGTKALDPSQRPRVEVVGVIQPDEQPNAFVHANKPETDEFHYVQRLGMTDALGLPPDTPLIMSISTQADTEQHRQKSLLDEARSGAGAGAGEAPSFPIAKNVKDLITFTTMPTDHMNYAAVWVSLCVILGFMARHAVVNPLRSVRMVDGMTREKWQESTRPQ